MNCDQIKEQRKAGTAVPDKTNTDKQVNVLLPNDSGSELEFFKLREGETFPEYEKRVFYGIKAKIKCPDAAKFNCSGEVTSKGIGGSKTQGGFSLIQLKCSGGANICNRTFRLSATLAPYPSLLALYQEALKKCNEIGIRKNVKGMLFQPKFDYRVGDIRNLKKRPRVDEAPVMATREPAATAIDLMSFDTGSTEVAKEKQDESHESVEIDENDKKIVSSDENEISKLREQLKRALQENMELKELTKSLMLKLDQFLEKQKLPVQPSTKPKVTRNTNKLIQEQNEKEKKEKKEKEKEKEKAKSAETSYSEIVKKNRPNKKKINPKTKKEWAKKLIAPVSAPQEFVRIHLKLNDTRRLRTLSGPEKSGLIRTMFKQLDIKNEVIDFSRIGNSIIEIITLRKFSNKINVILNENGILLPKFNPSEVPSHGNKEKAKECIVKRLSFMYARAKTADWRRALLEGYSEEILSAVTQPTKPGSTGMDLSGSCV